MNELNAITETNTNATTTADDRELYYAQPYAFDGAGFYFTDHDSFYRQLQASRWEEFELQCLTCEDGELFKACGIDMTNLALWFDCVQELGDWEKVCLFYRCDDLGEDIETALANLDDTYISEGSPEDYARDLIDDCGTLDSMPEHLRYYFDYAAYARDMVLNGDVTAFRYNGTDYVATA